MGSVAVAMPSETKANSQKSIIKMAGGSSSSSSVISADAFETWVKESLSRLLGIEKSDASQIVTMMQSMNSIDHVNEYLFGLLGESEEGFEFIHSYNEKLPHVSSKPSRDDGSISVKSIPNGPTPQSASKYLEGSSIWHDSAKLFQQESREPESTSETLNQVHESGESCPPVNSSAPKLSNRQRKRIAKQMETIKATERVGNAPPGFQGRLICECFGTVHDLLTNCTSCGKIICLWEGPGPCAFCGVNVTSYEDELCKLYSNHSESSIQNALSRTMRLLNFDKTSAQRTQVHDLVSDFDTSAGIYDRWATAEERAAARERHLQKLKEEEEGKKRRVMTLDLQGRKFISEDHTKRPEIELKDEFSEPRWEKLEDNSDDDTVNNNNTVLHEDTHSSGVFINPNLKRRLRFVSPSAPTSVSPVK